jgi:hypothetical protein
LLLLTVLVFGALGAGSAASDNGRPQAQRDNGRGHWFERACDGPAARDAACNAQVVSNEYGVPLQSTSPPSSALGPSDFHTGYQLPTLASSGTPTIGIVDAFDDPNIESDLAAYDAYYGLPACTSASGCFRKVNQTGGTSYPSGTCSFKLPTTAGTYQLRLLSNNGYTLLATSPSIVAS